MRFNPAGTGRSLPEYAILLALIGAAAIPALMFLSGAIGNVFSDGGRGQTDQLFSLLDARTPSSSQGSPQSGTVPIAPSQTALASALSDLKTSGGTVAMNLDGAGNLQIKLNGMPLGGAQDSTGANGSTSMITYIMADQIQALSEEVAASDPSLSARLNYQAALVRNLALMEENINTAVSKGDQRALTIGQSPADVGQYAFPSSLPVNPLTGKPASMDLSSKSLPLLYFQLHQLAIKEANDLLSAGLPGSISDKLGLYTQAVDSVGNKHYATATDVFYKGTEKVPLVTVNANYNPQNPFSPYYETVNVNIDLNSFLLGGGKMGAYTVDTSGVTIDIAPKFTQVTADKIAQAQQAASASLDIPTSTPTAAAAPTAAADGITSNFSGSALPN